MKALPNKLWRSVYILVAATSLAAEGPDVVPKPSPVFSPARFLHGPEGVAYYPTHAARCGEKGTAVVNFVIGFDGSVQDAQIVKSTGYADLDVATLISARLSKFQPAARNGIPITAQFQIGISPGETDPMPRDGEDCSSVSGEKAAADLLSGFPTLASPSSTNFTTAQPIPGAFDVKNYYPLHAARCGESGLAVIDFIVDADGMVRDLNIVHSSGYADLDAATTLRARSWKFRPALLNGEPVPVQKQQGINFDTNHPLPNNGEDCSPAATEIAARKFISAPTQWSVPPEMHR